MWARLAVLLASAVAAAAVATPAAATVGGMVPVPAPAGCLLANPGSTGCGEAGPLTYPVEVEISSDGKTAYVVAYLSWTLVLYDVDQVTGALTRRTAPGSCFYDLQGSAVAGCTPARGLRNAHEIVLSPTEDRLYVSASTPGTVGVFKRAADGSLTQDADEKGCITASNPSAYVSQPCRLGHHLANARGIAAYGERIYVATNPAGSESDDGVAVLKVTAGGLEQDSPAGGSGCVIQTGGGATGCADGRGLNGAEQIAVSPDGENVYVTGFDGQSVAALERNLSTGDLLALTAPGGCLATTTTDGCTVVENMGQGEGIHVSHDGRHVYFTTRSGAHTLQLADRQADGTLVRRPGADGCIHGQGTASNCRQNRGISTPYRIVESPDGKFVYLASVFANAVTAYSRGSDGVLSIITDAKGCAYFASFPTCNLGPGLQGPQGLAISPDGRFLYTASIQDHSLTLLRRDTAAPACADASATVPAGNAVNLPLDCTDGDGDPVTIATLSAPSGGILGDVDQATRRVPFIAGQAPTTTSFTFQATANGVTSNLATYTLDIPAADTPAQPTCTPQPEIAGNGIDEDCNGADLPTPPERVAGTIRPVWRTFARYTILRRLRIEAISAGAKVQIRCAGRGCPFKRKTFTPRRGKVDASERFRRRRLRPGARVEVRITKPGAIGKVVTYTVRRRKLPRRIVRCLPVGATRPTAC